MRNGRPKTPIELTKAETTQLQAFARSRSLPAALCHRARIVLASAQGESNSSIATRLRLSQATVGKWRGNFLAKRIAGLYDDVRPGRPRSLYNDRALARWCSRTTGQPLVDAAMHELAATGYLSNRLRQVAASYLVYDLACHWRAGAAWFESQLLDYDVYNNQGNWLYIAGRGTDPRGGRRFDPAHQAAVYDADGAYQRAWTRQ